MTNNNYIIIRCSYKLDDIDMEKEDLNPII